ncbi:hypothetical protein [Anaerostipes butyraticus]|uniref:hypothetical protein n=1 Tax=Anaerostipes butyraticus TaxID=645466 RepID=UPI00320A4422
MKTKFSRLCPRSRKPIYQALCSGQRGALNEESLLGILSLKEDIKAASAEQGS